MEHKKKKITLILLGILIGFGVYGYYWYQGVQARDIEARNSIRLVTEYSALQDSISTEYERCQKLLVSESGNFSDFEYCKKFINWVDMQ